MIRPYPAVSHPAVEAYLSELSALLSGPARWRARIVAEIRDDVLCELEARLADGQPAPAAAVAVVDGAGAARVVAARFAEVRARWSVGRAAQVTVGCALAFGALIVLPAQYSGAGAHSVIATGAAGAAGWFAAQIAAVAAVITWLRVRRLRTAERPSARALTMALRAAAVAVGCAATALVLDASAVLRASVPVPAALGARLTVAGAVAVLAGFCLAHGTAQVRRFRRLADDRESRAASALEMLRSVARQLAERTDRWCAMHPGRVGPAVTATMAVADRVLVWAMACRARASATLATAAGGLLALASLHEHGVTGGLHQVLLASAAAAVLFAAEAAAVVVAVYAFDRLVGLWPPRREVAA